MKGNNGSGNNESRDLWETPSDLFENLKKQYIFYFDCCANANNTKCFLYSDNFENQKQIIENGVCWMNPPFSKANAMFQHFFKVVESGIAIYRGDNLETSIWQDLILKKADWIFILKGRTKYQGLENTSPRFNSILIGLNIDAPKHIKGHLIRLK